LALRRQQPASLQARRKAVLYITRSRIKESLQGSDLPAVNGHIDTEVIPAVQKVQGVRSARAYNSMAGEVTFVIDIQDWATVDRIVADPGVRSALGKGTNYLVRTGGEVLFDRPTWQQVYGTG
jgi:hypothetical protein